MSPSKSTSKTSILPPYTPMIPSVAPEPTLSNMLGSVMSAVGLQGRSSKAHNVRRFPTRPIRRPYLVSDDQQGSEQEVEGPRGEANTSAKPFGAVQCMTDSTSMFPSPVTDYQGPPTVRRTSIRPKLTVAPADDHIPSNGLEASEASSTPSPIDPDPTTVKSLSGVITLAPDATQTIDEAPKPPITESPPLPPNTVTAMFATPTTPETTQDINSVVTKWSSTPSGDTHPPTSTYVRWEDMTLSTLNTTARTDPVNYNTVRTRRNDVVNLAGESEIRTCDTGPSITSTETILSPTQGAASPDSMWSVAVDTAGAVSPDSMWLVAVETGTITETTMMPTQGAASPDSMWSVSAETATVTETEIGMQGGMSTVAASTVFATPAVRADAADAVETQNGPSGILGSGAIGPWIATMLLVGGLKGVKRG